MRTATRRRTTPISAVSLFVGNDSPLPGRGGREDGESIGSVKDKETGRQGDTEKLGAFRSLWSSAFRRLKAELQRDASGFSRHPSWNSQHLAGLLVRFLQIDWD